MGVRQESGCGRMATENSSVVGESAAVWSARFRGAFGQTGGDLESMAAGAG